MEVGTIDQLNLKKGDYVRCLTVANYDSPWTVGIEYMCPKDGELDCDGNVTHRSSLSTFRIIYRAPRDPKTWGEMTDDEKGALLLAKHEGKVIEYLRNLNWIETDIVFSEWYAYRIKPEPKRETVSVSVCGSEIGFDQLGQRVSNPTHRITFDLIDGEPDCSSVRMEKI